MSKFVLKSKTIIGAIITLIPTLATIFGYTLSADDTVMISQTADSIIQLLGASLVVYGRVKAKGGVHV